MPVFRLDACSNCWSLKARGSSRSFRCWLLKVKALLAITSADDGVTGRESSGNAGEAGKDGGDKEAEEEVGEEECISEAGERALSSTCGDQGACFKLRPLTILGRPCWNRQRVPYRQKPKALKVRQRAPRGFQSLERTGGCRVFSSAESDPEPRSTCRKWQRVPKGQTPKAQNVRQGTLRRLSRTDLCSFKLCTKRQRLPYKQ